MQDATGVDPPGAVDCVMLTAGYKKTPAYAGENRGGMETRSEEDPSGGTQPVSSARATSLLHSLADFVADADAIANDLSTADSWVLHWSFPKDSTACAR
jgi:hypothetical protein